MSTAEDTRAAAWRAQQVNRAKFVRTNEIRLRGSTSARRTLEDNWAPVINRTKENLTEDRTHG